MSISCPNNDRLKRYVLVNGYANHFIGLFLSIGDCMWDWCVENTIHTSQQFTFLCPSAFLRAGCMFDSWVFTEILQWAQCYAGLLFLALIRSAVVSSLRKRISICIPLHWFMYTAGICIFLYLFVVRVIVKALMIIISLEYECWYQDFPWFLVKSLQCPSQTTALLTQK